MIESDLVRRPGRPGRAATAGVAIIAVAVMAGAAAAERSRLAGSLTVLARLHWTWLPVGILLEAISMAAFAAMFRRLLSAGRVRPTRTSMLSHHLRGERDVGLRPAGRPGVAAAYLFRRFTRLGAGVLLAGWALLAGGVISSVTWALLLACGGLASGHTRGPGDHRFPASRFVVIVTAMIAVAARRPRLRAALERYLAQALKHGARLLRWPATDPKLALRAWAERFGALRVPPSTWALATGDGLVNWLADAGVLAVSILAVGAAVPWRDLLLVYAAGIGAQSLSLTPGGLAITEGAISVALVASGLRVGQAVAAAVLYRLISFWLIAAVGWLILLVLRARRPAAEAAPEPALEPAPGSAPGQPPATRAGRARAGPPARPARHRRRLAGGHGAAARPAARGGDRPPRLRRQPTPGRRIQRQRRRQFSKTWMNGRWTPPSWSVTPGPGASRCRRRALAPDRVKAVVLLAGVGPGSVSILDWLLAAPVIGPLSAQIMWRWTPWIARARLAWLSRRQGRPLYPGEHISLQVWGQKDGGAEPLWRAFLTEQRALLSELADLEAALPSIGVPVLLLADPADQIVPIMTAQRLASELPDARLRLVEHASHHLPRRAPGAVAEAIAEFLAAIDDSQPAGDDSQPADKVSCPG